MQRDVLTRPQIKAKFQKLLLGEKYTPQQRGFELEKLIYSVLTIEKLKPRSGYKPEGEQIDGSFYWNGQTYLLEAKWVADPLPASSIYSFKGKLDGKFHTTSGIFIAMNGYSKDVEDALKSGKSLNILLFDDNDMCLIFNGEVPFLKVLKFKLRQAGDTGSLQVPYRLKEKAKEISFIEPTQVLKSDKIASLNTKNSIIDDLLIFVEGQSDIPLIKNFIDPIKHKYSLSYRIEALNGLENLRQIPSLINIYGDLKETKALIIILDANIVAGEMSLVIQNVREQLDNSSIYVSTQFLYLSESLKIKLRAEQKTENLQKEAVFQQLENFINQIAEEYFDPVVDVPQKALHGALSQLEWNFNDGVLEGDDYTGTPFKITTLEKLIEYLEDEIGSALNAIMPIDWLNSHDFEHSDEVREFLLENYANKIEKLGWDPGNL